MTESNTASGSPPNPTTQSPVTRSESGYPRPTVAPTAPINFTELLLAFGTCTCLLMSALLSLAA